MGWTCGKYVWFCGVLLGISLVTGCRNARPAQPAMPAESLRQRQEDYGQAYKQIMFEWRDHMMQLTSRPLPSRSTPSAKKREKVASDIDDIARVNLEFARRLDVLPPPAGLEEVHACTRAFFQHYGEANDRWAAAIRRRDRTAAEAALARMDRDMRADLTRMKAAAEKIGATLPGFDRAIAALDEAGQPQKP